MGRGSRLEPAIGPRFARTRWASAGTTSDLLQGLGRQERRL